VICIHLAVQIINETLPALQQLKAQGLVRFVGITGLPLKALQYVLDRVPAGASLRGRVKVRIRW
jgi:diketogulonate reductase-like aldo/keto reductase